ncbi:double-stranded RNA-binding protein Staufen homolog isoform X2 [Nilaparvata lugens]|uniref:double-stranded RNA-binding protein Staufen homolog isoform X2 n=1 Tax=Nilaparvata lugens TaxID=108931 RepID=UPI00193D9C81|nr:double-stranded RNA-binding protein Staufen homolog isoform X2 [Nilaparvata lugens]XP_039301230.1 double-stranded RNA-binding protein Staufen homolog isoform X2 [Nilaparvata lugens]
MTSNKTIGRKPAVSGVLTMADTQPPPIQDTTITTCAAGGDQCPSSAETQEKESLKASNYTANFKEKTPMCLVNELARYNKISHQYRLTEEQGPPHQKRFMVTLKLGEEEYAADGASIKKAQHAAASNALELTKYDHPPPKASKSRLTKGNITPTVELNALAMRRGEPTVYTIIEPAPDARFNQYPYDNRGFYNQGRFPVPNNMSYTRRNGSGRGAQARFGHHMHDNQRAFGRNGATSFRVSVKVGERTFEGEGITAQAARHDAASKALDELRHLPVEENRVAKGFSPLSECEDFGSCVENDSSSDLKSPISLVHELALKRNLSVTFQVIDERGPPHMRTFVTRCQVADSFVTTGEGNGKKVSKKRAAEKMLEELRTLPPTTTVNASGMSGSMNRMKRKTNPTKKKSRNLIRAVNPTTTQEKPETEVADEINPISRLIQIQQAKKEKEPVYTLKEERGGPRKKEFVIEVSVGEYSYNGTGPNKKLAKRNAAEGLLQEMGYSTPTTQPGYRKMNMYMNQEKQDGFMNQDKQKSKTAGGSGGRQLVPGVLLMTDNTRSSSTGSNGKSGFSNLQTTAALAKEYINGGNQNQNEVRSNSGDGMSGVRPKDQLMYLAKLLGFTVQYSDFPKGNHSEFLSLVSLSTEPPHVCHGSGKTTDQSHDQAALTALRALSKMGLDTVAPTKKETNSQSGDGLFGSNISPSAETKTSYVNGASSK